MVTREKILESLIEISDRSQTGSRSELVHRVLHTALHLVEGDGAVLLSPRQRVPERFILRTRDQTPEETVAASSEHPFLRWSLRRGQAIAIPDIASDARIEPADGCPGVDSGPALFAPLKLRDHAPSYLAVYRRRGRAPFGPDEIRVIAVLGAWTAMALENWRLSESVEKLAVTDDLTQVHNYRFLKTALRREIKRAGRFNQKLSLVMIDVDNLKSYNDRNGHMRGSLLLKEIAGLFAGQIRSFDLVAKYGGDEFTLILPQTDRHGACVVAERMRDVIASHTFPLAPPGGITVSLGVATFPEDAKDTIGLIEASDRALYAAKQRGRNRVEMVEERAA